MYNWRKMTDKFQQDVLNRHKALKYPWHGPPHHSEKSFYHISAACYELKPLIGSTIERMIEFEDELVQTLRKHSEYLAAWCVFRTMSLSLTTKALGNMHGRFSCFWNGEDNKSGRKCFHRCSDRKIRSEAHKWATLNYMHHNPVHHGYVDCWQDWHFSSATSYLNAIGREEAARKWKEFPLKVYGKGWDDPDS